MSYGVAAALQQAVFERLRGDAALEALVGDAIYDAVPNGAVPPLYVTLGPEDARARDDATVAFQLVKTYRSGAQVAVRPIVKPVPGSVRMGLANVEMREGVHYEVDTTTGIVTFSEPPNRDVAITAGYEFDVPVRFDTDRIQTSLASFQAGEVPNVPVVEIRV